MDTITNNQESVNSLMAELANDLQVYVQNAFLNQGLVYKINNPEFGRYNQHGDAYSADYAIDRIESLFPTDMKYLPKELIDLFPTVKGTVLYFDNPVVHYEFGLTLNLNLNDPNFSDKVDLSNPAFKAIIDKYDSQLHFEEIKVTKVF